MTKSGYLKRYRFPVAVMKIAVLLHLVLPSRLSSLLLFFLCRATVSYKTICDWSIKFKKGVDCPLPRYDKKKPLICHADEKFIRVLGVWHYWWSLKDYLGNVIARVISPQRDYASAKSLMKKGRARINRDVDILVRDGLTAYNRATKYLGRRCKSLVAGIHGAPVIHNRNFYWLTNNPAESLNSQIDAELSRVQYNFQSLATAERFADDFMLCKYLKKCFSQKKYSEATSTLEQAILL